MLRSFGRSIVALVLFGSIASAQIHQQCFTASVPLQFTNWSTSVNLPKFDPLQGQLVAVQLSVGATQQGIARAENLDVAPVSLTIDYMCSVTLSRPDLSVLSVCSPLTVFMDSLAGSDGTLDFGGPSGVTHSGIVSSSTSGVSLPTIPSDLVLFAGPAGAPGSIALPITATGTSFAFGGGNLVTQFTSQVSARVDVCYTYDTSRSVRVHKSTTTLVPGRLIDGYVLVENTGAVPAIDLEVLDSLDPRVFHLVDTAPQAALDTQTLAALGLIVWRVPFLAAGQSLVLTYQARVDPATPIGTQAPLGPLWSGHNLATHWLNCSDIARAEHAECSCLISTCPQTCDVDPLVCLSCRAGELQGCPDLGRECLGAIRDEVIACFDSVADIAGRFFETAAVVGPFDPNEKRSPNPMFVRANERLVYFIHYENTGTLPAIDLTVRDTLDPNLNLATLELLTPGGQLDAQSRTVTWHLTAPLDPGATGNVALAVLPTATLPGGTQLVNRAGIQFEQQPPIQTNSVMHVIDTVRPAGTMLPLAPSISTEVFSLEWSGVDGVGHAESFTVLYSVDGSPYSTLLSNTTETSTLFVGHAGSHYEFYCVAQDSAGNVELQNPGPEASTTVAVAGSAFCSGDGTAATCPCGNASAPGDNAGCLNSLGLAGKLVATGVPSVTSDTMQLVGSGMPNCPALYFQGSSAIDGGLGVPFGDGLRCAGGALRRLKTKTNAANGSVYPEGNETPIALRTGSHPGDVRVYQCWYRNAADFCTSATFNSTNAVLVTWTP